jgi:hypothetical protein
MSAEPPLTRSARLELALLSSTLKDTPEIILAMAKRWQRQCKPQDRAFVEKAMNDLEARIEWLRKHGHLGHHLIPDSQPQTVRIYGALKAAYEIGVMAPFAAARALENEDLRPRREINKSRGDDRRKRLRAAIKAAEPNPNRRQQGITYAEKLLPVVLQHLTRSPTDPVRWPSAASIRDELKRMRPTRKA